MPVKNEIHLTSLSQSRGKQSKMFSKAANRAQNSQQVLRQQNGRLLCSTTTHSRSSTQASTNCWRPRDHSRIPCLPRGFRGSLISRIHDFVPFAGRNFCEFGFQILLLGTNFRGSYASFCPVFHVRHWYIQKWQPEVSYFLNMWFMYSLTNKRHRPGIATQSYIVRCVVGLEKT